MLKRSIYSPVSAGYRKLDHQNVWNIVFRSNLTSVKDTYKFNHKKKPLHDELRPTSFADTKLTSLLEAHECKDYYIFNRYLINLRFHLKGCKPVVRSLFNPKWVSGITNDAIVGIVRSVGQLDLDCDDGTDKRICINLVKRLCAAAPNVSPIQIKHLSGVFNSLHDVNFDVSYVPLGTLLPLYISIAESCAEADESCIESLVRSMGAIKVPWISLPETTRIALLSQIVVLSTNFNTAFKKNIIFGLGQMHCPILNEKLEIRNKILEMAYSVFMSESESDSKNGLNRTITGLSMMEVTFNDFPHQIQKSIHNLLRNSFPFFTDEEITGLIYSLSEINFHHTQFPEKILLLVEDCAERLFNKERLKAGCLYLSRLAKLGMTFGDLHDSLQTYLQHYCTHQYVNLTPKVKAYFFQSLGQLQTPWYKLDKPIRDELIIGATSAAAAVTTDVSLLHAILQGVAGMNMKLYEYPELQETIESCITRNLQHNWKFPFNGFAELFSLLSKSSLIWLDFQPETRNKFMIILEQLNVEHPSRLLVLLQALVGFQVKSESLSTLFLQRIEYSARQWPHSTLQDVTSFLYYLGKLEISYFDRSKWTRNFVDDAIVQYMAQCNPEDMYKILVGIAGIGGSHAKLISASRHKIESAIDKNILHLNSYQYSCTIHALGIMKFPIQSFQSSTRENIMKAFRISVTSMNEEESNRALQGLTNMGS